MLRMASSFPEEVLEHVFSFIHSDKDRNAISLVCKSWYEVERCCRRRIFVGNCYSVSPPMVIRRFPELRSVELKGKPHFADFNLVPDGWGGYVYPWIEAMANAYPWLEEIRLKRMVVTDETLELIAKSFKNFKVLMLSSCEGFSTDGLAAIAANCSLILEKGTRQDLFVISSPLCPEQPQLQYLDLLENGGIPKSSFWVFTGLEALLYKRVPSRIAHL